MLGYTGHTDGWWAADSSKQENAPRFREHVYTTTSDDAEGLLNRLPGCIRLGASTTKGCKAADGEALQTETPLILSQLHA